MKPGKLADYLAFHLVYSDTDDVKQKNKNHETSTEQIFPWTENKEVFRFSSSVSKTKFWPIISSLSFN